MEDTPDIKINEKNILGKGSYGTVYLGSKVNKDSTIKIALKEIPSEIENDQDAKNSLSNEIIVSSYLDNTNIVRMIDIVYKNKKRYLAYEYCNGGDLRNYINYFKRFDEELIQIIIIKMVNALFELHKKGVIHHDIKPENILIQLYPGKDTKEIEVKIGKIKEKIKTKKDENNPHFETAGYYCNYNLSSENNINQKIITPNSNNYQNMDNFYNNNFNLYSQNNKQCFQNNNNNFNPCFQNNNFNLNNNQNNINNNMMMLFNQFNNFLNNNNFNNMNNFNNNINGFPMYNINNPNSFNINYQNYLSNNQLNNNKNSQFNSINIQNNDDDEIDDDEYILNILKGAQFKLSDFGLSKLKNEINEKNVCGSPLYMAPELLSRDCKIIRIEDPRVDIWALGVMAFEMFFGKRPFKAFSIPELIKLYQKGEYYIDLKNIKEQKISKEFIEFISLCLQVDPEKRANVGDLRNSSFYNMSYKTLEIMDTDEFKEYLGCKDNKDNNIVLSINTKYLKY